MTIQSITGAICFIQILLASNASDPMLYHVFDRFQTYNELWHLNFRFKCFCHEIVRLEAMIDNNETKAEVLKRR